MTALRPAPSPTEPVWRRWVRSLHRRIPDEIQRLLLLSALSVLVAVVLVAFPDPMPISLMAVPLVIGSTSLGPREMPWFVGINVAALLVALMTFPDRSPRVLLATLVVVALGVAILVASMRSRLGVAGERGGSMLVDLRERILRDDGLIGLPGGWYAESALRSAGGTPFAGDFVVTSHERAEGRLQIVVVDVSGKGAEAGTRALLLSGAFRALLDALPPSRFLYAANAFLMRQDWDEGFATAVHLTLHLETGEYQVRTAGHPPAVQLSAGSGRWVPLETEGPALGLLDDVEYVGHSGRLGRGDAILLYTDGLVEAPNRDLAMGIDRLLGRAERLLPRGFDDGAGRLIESLGSRRDDRALVLVHRR